MSDRHHLPGFAKPRAGPCVRHAAHVHLDVEDIADQSVLDDLLQSQEVTVVTPVVEDGERLLALLGRRDHLIGLLDGDAHRLLEDDMLARVEALDGQLGMGVVRGDDNGEVHGLVGIESLVGGVGGDAGEVLRRDLDSGGIDVADGRKDHPVGAVDPVPVVETHVEAGAVADRRATDLLLCLCRLGHSVRVHFLYVTVSRLSGQTGAMFCTGLAVPWSGAGRCSRAGADVGRGSDA